MSLQIHNIGKKKKNRKRVGRGNASGHGTYCCRGLKGQRSRSGGKSGLKLRGFKQNLLNIPKMKGTKSIRPNAQVVNLSDLEKHYSEDLKVTPGNLLEKGLIDKSTLPVKILRDKKFDKLTRKLEVFGCLLSGSAKDIIEKAGGKVVGIEKVKSQESKVKS
ncbi:50S ribosomal protein L15 [Candidatus Kuenenbacteria bacterium]|nr:50S ribosomal protein L15 [Candidatus Kuenenbacteria bacterium]